MNPRTVLITQSNYIPWKGYFDAINVADIFVLYDSVQYTKRDWRNRNKIKTRDGVSWLSIPVEVSGRFHQSIRETHAVGNEWRQKHWQTIVHNYSRAPFFREIAELIAPVFLNQDSRKLTEINKLFLETICGFLTIKTTFVEDNQLQLQDERNERLLSICLQLGATRYISGPSARAYLNIQLFADAGVDVKFLDFGGYPRYPQLFGEFVHEVSVLDLLFNVGADSANYLQSFSREGLARFLVD